MDLKALEVGGGKVSSGRPWHLEIPVTEKGYTDAQLDDYHGLKRRKYLWNPGLSFSIRARFSHGSDSLVGTAGFGFWNAPFGDPTTRWPALPQAVWFFYASAPSDLPLDIFGPGRGWFVSTIDVGLPKFLAITPLSPAILLLNQMRSARVRIWPRLRDYFGIAFHPVKTRMDDWHEYGLSWNRDNCEFWIDGHNFFQTTHSPSGPLGFVCWIDNQYMVLTPRGYINWGNIAVKIPQWLEFEKLAINQIEDPGFAGDSS